MKPKKVEHKDVVDVQAQRKAWAKNRLSILDGRLGNGIGAERERARLNLIIHPKKK